MSRQDSKAAILAAATRLAAQGRLSLRAVAQAAGVSRQAVHYHFGGLASLRQELAAAGVAGVADAIPRPNTRDRILAAAERLLSRPGAGNASIDAIAAEAGVSKGAVYHHFHDRAALLRAVARRVSWVDRVEAAVSDVAAGSDRDQLIAMAHALAAVTAQRADLLRNLASAGARDPELADIVAEEIGGRGAPVLFGWLQRRVEAGTIRPVDPSVFVQALFGAAGMRVLLGSDVLDRLERRGVRAPDQQIEGYIDLLLHGLERRPDDGLEPQSPGRSGRPRRKV
jgi:AcrR family transcriptional regulator